MKLKYMKRKKKKFNTHFTEIRYEVDGREEGAARLSVREVHVHSFEALPQRDQRRVRVAEESTDPLHRQRKQLQTLRVSDRIF